MVALFSYRASQWFLLQVKQDKEPPQPPPSLLISDSVAIPANPGQNPSDQTVTFTPWGPASLGWRPTQAHFNRLATSRRCSLTPGGCSSEPRPTPQRWAPRSERRRKRSKTMGKENRCVNGRSWGGRKAPPPPPHTSRVGWVGRRSEASRYGGTLHNFLGRIDLSPC